MNIIENDTRQIFTLTKEQQTVYDTLINFLANENQQEMMLLGFAGSGKTFLVSRYINDIIKNKLCRRIVVSTPTHKSLNVMKSKLFETSLTSTISNNIDIMTIHRLLNYQRQIDSNGDVYFGKNGADSNWNVYDLIIIDECSMLSNQIINDIEDELKKVKNKKLKILYIADPCQINPVNQESSEIFNKKMKTLTLEKIIRTNSQKIMKLSNAHRRWITSNKDSDMPCLADYADDRIILHSIDSVNKWLDKFVSLLKKLDINTNVDTYTNDSNNLENNVILTWTNKKCNKYNDYVRQKMFNKKILKKYELGEILIFNDFHRTLINSPTDTLNNETETKPELKIVSFYTSEQIKLIGIKEDKFQFEKIKNLKSTDLPELIANNFVKVISAINKTLTSTLLNVYYMEIQKLSELKNTEQKIVYNILSIHHDSEINYNKLKNYFEDQIVKLKNSCYKMINELKKTNDMIKLEFLNIVEKKINRIWKDWQANVMDRFAQLNYGYAITVHKSQGSTFKNVFIDIMDIFENHNQSERLKCLYTAITRSSNSLELLI